MNDGKTSGVAVPSLESQKAMCHFALEKASVRRSEIGYVEAHATGTSLGDQIEINALGLTMGKSGGLALGSVKSFMGHLEGLSR